MNTRTVISKQPAIKKAASRRKKRAVFRPPEVMAAASSEPSDPSGVERRSVDSTPETCPVRGPQRPPRGQPAVSRTQEDFPAAWNLQELEDAPFDTLARALATDPNLPLAAAMIDAVAEELDPLVTVAASGAAVEANTLERLMYRCRLAADVAALAALAAMKAAREGGEGRPGD